MRGAWLVFLVLAGCGSAGGELPADGSQGAVDLGADQGPVGFALTRMDPAMVAFRGQTVTVDYRGTPPASVIDDQGQPTDVYFEVNGAMESLTCGGNDPPCPPSGWTLSVRRGDVTQPNQPITIVAWGARDGQVVGQISGAYLPPAPPTPSLHVDAAYGPNGPDGFDNPLAPELDRACARSDVAYLTNDGDLPFTVASASLSGDGAFTIANDTCSGMQLGAFQVSSFYECAITLCFSSSAPGGHSGMLAVSTSAGTVSASFSATVDAASSGFDTTLGGNGVLPVPITTSWNPSSLLPYRPSQTPAALLGSGVMVSAAPQGLAYVAPDGTVTSWQAVGQVVALASAWDLGSVYRASGFYTDHWTTAGMDTTFGTNGQAPAGIASMVGATNLGALAVAPNGNILLDGYDFSLEALTSAGAVDTAFGQNGALQLGVEASMIVDAQGRAYVGLRSYTDATHWTDTLARFSSVDGSRDATFSYAASGVLALDAQGRLYVASGNSVARLDDTGGATPIASSAPFSLSDSIYDLAFDQNGKLLVAHGADRVLRFLPDGTFDAQLGLPGALRILCPPQGGCWAIGKASIDGYVSRLAL